MIKIIRPPARVGHFNAGTIYYNRGQEMEHAPFKEISWWQDVFVWRRRNTIRVSVNFDGIQTDSPDFVVAAKKMYDIIDAAKELRIPRMRNGVRTGIEGVGYSSKRDAFDLKRLGKEIFMFTAPCGGRYYVKLEDLEGLRTF